MLFRSCEPTNTEFGAQQIPSQLSMQPCYDWNLYKISRCPKGPTGPFGGAIRQGSKTKPINTYSLAGLRLRITWTDSFSEHFQELNF